MEKKDENEVAKSKPKGSRGKPPTRLQIKAPAALHLDKNDNSLTAIPLLSPLIFSPLTLQEEEVEEDEKQLMGSPGNDHDHEKGSGNNNNGNISASPSPSPSPPPSLSPSPSQTNGNVEALRADASSLFTFFQSQCVLVNHGQ